jgi:hypothetical protein
LFMVSSSRKNKNRSNMPVHRSIGIARWWKEYRKNLC